MKKAVVLLSGGIDSATVLYHVIKTRYRAFCLSFDYGQRHKKELFFAKRLARYSGSDWKLIKISFPWKGSSLLDKNAILPRAKTNRKDIPSTYVPGRNIIFLSHAASYAEAIGADTIFIGANQIDYSGYPDCRSSFLRSFESSINKGTKAGVEGRRFKIKTPLIKKTKVEILKMAAELGVPLKSTWSCYRGEKTPCGKCDSCVIRKKAFEKIGIKDIG